MRADEEALCEFARCYERMRGMVLNTAERCQAFLVEWLRAADFALEAAHHPRCLPELEEVRYVGDGHIAPRPLRIEALERLGSTPQVWVREFPRHAAHAVFFAVPWPSHLLEFAVLDLVGEQSLMREDTIMGSFGAHRSPSRSVGGAPNASWRTVYAHVPCALGPVEAKAFEACLELDEMNGDDFDAALAYMQVPRRRFKEPVRASGTRTTRTLEAAMRRVGIDFSDLLRFSADATARDIAAMRREYHRR